MRDVYACVSLEHKPDSKNKKEMNQLEPKQTTKKKRTFANGPNGKIPGIKPQTPEICPRPVSWGLSGAPLILFN